MGKASTTIVFLAGWLFLAGSAAAAEAPRVGLPVDWSHRAMIHRVDTMAEAMAKGEYQQWQRDIRDPRFLRAVLERSDRERAKARAAAKQAPVAKAAPGVEVLIDHYYLTILGRAADAGGRAFHASEVERLAAVDADRVEALRAISKNFFWSPEYLAFNRSDADFVEDLYRAYLQRSSDAGGKSFWLGQMSVGLNRDAVMLSFMFSEEFDGLMEETVGENLQRPETGVVLSVYRSAFSRLPDTGGFTNWRESLRAGQCEGSIGAKARDLLFQSIQSPEYLARNRTSRQYVADLYEAIFRRAPDADGFSFWAGQLDSAAMTREQVLDAFLGSEEWAAILFTLADAGCTSATTVPRDWSNVMGGAAGVGTKGTFPAKYSFDINAAPSCDNDFVVYPTGSPGVTGAGNFLNRQGGTFTGNTAGGTVTITNTNGAGPDRVLVLTRSFGTQVAGIWPNNDGLNFNTDNTTTHTQKAAHLAAAINRNGGTVGVRATSVGARVDVFAITQGLANSSITLVDTLNNFGWGGNMTGGAGTAGQPTIIAFNQLYKTTCDDPAEPPVRPLPNTFWSYNTGTGTVVETSPVISLDGTQVAFIERNTGTNTASLVLLKWSSTVSVGTVGAPTVPNLAGSANAYRTGAGCALPCMFKISFGGGVDNRRSSPYYDYISDSIYVGAANGTLRKFNGVFNGTPAAAGVPWPVTVSAGNALSSPVYDGYSGLVFVGSARAMASGGQLHTVDAAGVVVSSATLAGLVGGTPGTGVAESPVVDGNAQRVYAFVASDNTTNCNSGADPCQAVYQFQTNVSIAGLGGTKRTIGRGGQFARTLKTGAFDNNYWTSSVTSPTGFLYVCGALGDTSDTDRPTLWRIPITANVMGAAAVGPGMTIAAGPDSEECSPMTEVVNGGVDQLFVAVPNASIFGCGGGGCMYRFNITSITPANWAATTPTAVLAAPGGAGGIIIDNISSVTGAGQIYYSTLTAPGNAIQASQPALN